MMVLVWWWRRRRRRRHLPMRRPLRPSGNVLVRDHIGLGIAVMHVVAMKVPIGMEKLSVMVWMIQPGGLVMCIVMLPHMHVMMVPWTVLLLLRLKEVLLVERTVVLLLLTVDVMLKVGLGDTRMLQLLLLHLLAVQRLFPHLV